MSTYFKLKCFEPETTKKIIIISNIIIAALGVVHWDVIFNKFRLCSYFLIFKSLLQLYATAWKSQFLCRLPESEKDDGFEFGLFCNHRNSTDYK